MNLFDGHDRFVRKNAALASGYQIGRKDKKMEEMGKSRLEGEKEASCFNCKFRNKCKTFDKLRTGGTDGVVSYGGDSREGNYLCDKYEAMVSKKNSMSEREIKSLLKNAKMGRI